MSFEMEGELDVEDLDATQKLVWLEVACVL